MFNGIKKSLSIFFAIGVFISIWQGLIWAFNIPRFLLPSPASVAMSLFDKGSYIFKDFTITLLEIFLGLLIGSTLGIFSALLLQMCAHVRRWVFPVLIVSQSIPLYAIAPILVLWLGYDLAPKVVMVVIIIFFPITVTFYDALRTTPKGYIDLAESLGAKKSTILFKIRIPAGLPALGSGLRVAATFAPIGAIVGEWVGASAGLGYRMVYANARMQTADMFAALSVLVCTSLLLYYFVDFLIRKALPWHFDKTINNN